jgi:hypothetical protein
MSGTTPRGYTYPSSTDHDRIWEHFQELATDIDTDVGTVATNFDAWTAYTPTLGNAGGSPALGNGTIIGRLRRMGKTVHYTAKLTGGGTTNFGSGFLRLGIPSVPNTAIDYVGTALLLNGSIAGTGGYISATSMVSGAVPYVLLYGVTGGVMTNTSPFTCNGNTVIRWSGTYEEA